MRSVKGVRLGTTCDDLKHCHKTLAVPDLIIRAKRLLGKSTFQQGELSDAEHYFNGAIEALEGVRASLQIDEFKAAYVGDKLGVYGDMVALLLPQGRTREALEYAERAKSRALLDMLSKGVEARAPSSDPALERLSQRLKEVRSELNWYYLAAEEEGDERLALAESHRGASAK